MTIHAWAAKKKKGPLGPFEYEPTPLGPHDVAIAISHCGICHSDVHLVDGDWGVGTYPMVPGHEIVGSVVEAGPAVRHLKAGERVGVGWQRSACLACEVCIRGEENLCRSDEATCVGHHGGFADRIRVDARFAFPIPDALSSEAAAPLLCGGVTVYAPLSRLARPSMRVGSRRGRRPRAPGNPVRPRHGLRGHRPVVHARRRRTTPVASARTTSSSRGRSRPLAGLARTLDVVLSTAFVAQDWPGLVSAAAAERDPVPGRRPDRATEPLRRGPPRRAEKRDRQRHRGAARHPRDARVRGPARGGAEVQVRPMAEADAALDDVRQGRARYRAVLAA